MEINVNINNRILIGAGLVILIGAAFLLLRSPEKESAQKSEEKSGVAKVSEEQKAFGMRLLSGSETVETYVPTQMKICYDNGGRNSCYKQVGQLLFDQFGYQKVLDTFHATEDKPEIFSRCHEVTHYIGRNAYSEIKSIPVLYSQDHSVCHGGFYHGVIEEYFAEKNLLPKSEPSAELASTIQTVCGSERDYSVPRFYAECVHGIGHAMMYITEAELPQSLTYCDALPARGDQETCYGGALMENSSSSTNFDHPTKYLDASKPNYPCTILDEHYLVQCYKYQSSYFAEISRWDWQNVVKLCQQVPLAYQDGCFNIIGSNQVGFSQDSAVWKKDCNYIADLSYRASCIIGVISALGGRYVGEGGLMVNFCNSVDANMQEPCFRATGNVASTWSQDGNERVNVCTNIESDLAKTWCFGG